MAKKTSGFKPYRYEERKSQPFISLNRMIAFITRGFIEKYNLGEYKHVELQYEASRRVVRLLFSKERTHPSLFIGDILRGNDWEGFRRFSLDGFWKRFELDWEKFTGRYEPTPVKGIRGYKVFDITLE